MRFILLPIMLVTLFTQMYVFCGEHVVAIGAAVGASTSPYKDHDNDLVLLPTLNYEGRHAYIQGTSAGIHLLNNDRHQISIGASYSALHFDPDDTDSRPHKALDKRKSTVMADVSYALVTPLGRAKVTVSRDVLGRSDGYTADASFSVPITRNNFTIVPTLGVEWMSEKHADYYFGISRAESTRSGLRRHEVSSSVSPYISLESRYQINERWSAVGGVKVNALTGKAKDSPMVGRSVTVGGFVGMLFTF